MLRAVKSRDVLERVAVEGNVMSGGSGADSTKVRTTEYLGSIDSGLTKKWRERERPQRKQ